MPREKIRKRSYGMRKFHTVCRNLQAFSHIARVRNERDFNLVACWAILRRPVAPAKASRLPGPAFFRDLQVVRRATGTPFHVEKSGVYSDGMPRRVFESELTVQIVLIDESGLRQSLRQIDERRFARLQETHFFRTAPQWHWNFPLQKQFKEKSSEVKKTPEWNFKGEKSTFSVSFHATENPTRLFRWSVQNSTVTWSVFDV